MEVDITGITLIPLVRAVLWNNIIISYITQLSTETKFT